MTRERESPTIEQQSGRVSYCQNHNVIRNLP